MNHATQNALDPLTVFLIMSEYVNITSQQISFMSSADMKLCLRNGSIFHEKTK